MNELTTIFFTFFKIGLFTFGGGYAILPILQKDVEQKLHWSTGGEILDYYAISQSLPGIIAVNISMFIGHARRKFPGLVAAALGIVAPSIIVILIIALFIENILHYEAVAHAFNGIRVAVAALVLDASVNMWENSVKDRACALIFLVSMLVFAFADVTPILPVVAGAVSGIIITGRRGLP
ncbi:MAG: chromate transporter [Synergistaceae bacterium]|nr:chromate transporter [Synergistaceae bacterium]